MILRFAAADIEEDDEANLELSNSSRKLLNVIERASSSSKSLKKGVDRDAISGSSNKGNRHLNPILASC